MKTLLRKLSRQIPPIALSHALFVYSTGNLIATPDFSNPKLAKLACFSERRAPRRLLIDVSHQVYNPVKGGIPRVVHKTAEAFLSLEQSAFCFEFVMLLNGKLYTARRFAERILDLDAGSLGIDRAIRIANGDDLLLLDCVMDKYPHFISVFDSIHAHGGSVNTVINDILALAHPQWFPQDFAEAYRKAMPLVIQYNDCLFCVSGATENAVREWISRNMPERLNGIAVTRWEQGGELKSAGAETMPIRPDLSAFLQTAAQINAPIFVLLSTIEPRKGQDFALDCFEHLWADGEPFRLVFMGRKGWKSEALYQRIMNHAEMGKRFLFVECGNDREVNAVLSASTALISPSLDEGYGLPLVEAALMGLPCVVSDIPIYREVADEGGIYFALGNAEEFRAGVRYARELSENERKEIAAKVKVGQWKNGAHEILQRIQTRQI